MADREEDRRNDVAIIGMAGRFPGARTLEEYWRNLRDGVEGITFFSDDELLESGLDPGLLRSPRYVKAAPLLPHDPGLFDAAFFGFTPREAEIMDPQHRILLECAWEALEHAGYDSEQYGGRIGIYAGSSFNTYLLANLAATLTAADGFQAVIRNDKDYLTTNISYKLNLNGPSVAVQTACSTALVAVHLAAQSLLNRECDLALAGGIRVVVPQRAGYLHEPGGVFSPDGHCRAFDREAEGTVFGSGAGLVVLKRFEDAIADRDRIHAVIKGSAVNNDGAAKVGFTAPGFEGQKQVIAEALGMAGVSAATITYVETHGTGTPLGDPLEVAALTAAYGVEGRCAIGSVKSNIGHLEAAAGIASLIKTVLALEHRAIPPSLHVETANPRIDFTNSPFYVNGALTPWPNGSTPRRAGVSSFGIGGTNAHAILEEAPPVRGSRTARALQLLVLSAKTPTALDAATTNLARHLEAHPDTDLADAAYTLQMGRRAQPYRRMLVCRDVADAAAALHRRDTTRLVTAPTTPRTRSVVWMFPGQGSQHVSMLAEVYRSEPVFRECLDRCATLLVPHLGEDLRRVLYADVPGGRAAAASQLNQTGTAQPALFAVEYALARLLTSWGLRPQAMIGHSIGEYVAACLAGVFSLEDALGLVATRARLMQALPAGAMLAVALPERELEPLLDRHLAVAAVNAPALCTATGTIDAIDALARRLADRGIESRVLHTSHAFHSPMMEPVASGVLESVRRASPRPPRIPFVSNLTGTWIRDDEATDPGYWVRQLRHTVRFGDAIATVLRDQDAVLLEVGPGQTLATLARQHPQRSSDHVILSVAGRAAEDDSSAETLMTAIGRLWLAGVPIDWSAFHAREERCRVPLPTYPFERKRYWVEARSSARRTPARQLPDAPLELSAPATADAPVNHGRPHLATAYAEPESDLERTVARIWEAALGIARVGRDDDFFELGGHSLLLIAIRSKIQDALQVDVPPAWVADVSTVAQLAARIEAARAGGPAPTAARSPLVVIQPGGTRTPVFCVHPSAGKLVGFRELARHLGSDQPFYGLQAPAIDEANGDRFTVAETALRDIEALRSVQPHGPYVIAGYSFGGVVAAEIARQLELQGERVRILALLDTMPLPRGIAPGDVPDERVFLAWFAWEMGRLSRRDLGLSFVKLLELDVEAGLQHVLDRAGLAASDRSLREIRELFRVFVAQMLALWEHVPEPLPAGTNVHVFRALETLGGDLAAILPPQLLRHVLDVHLADSTYGWGRLTMSRPTVHLAPGNHHSMLAQPHIRSLATRLRRAIDDALRPQANRGGDGEPSMQRRDSGGTVMNGPGRDDLRADAIAAGGAPSLKRWQSSSRPEQEGATMIERDLVGTWRLVSWELRSSSNELVLYPFGDAIGYAIYGESGHMSLSIMKANRPKSTSANPLVASTADNAAAAESYFSYCGRYEVRDGTVVHHIEAGLFPNWVGESQERRYAISGDRLSLTAPADAGGLELAHHLEWERVR